MLAIDASRCEGTSLAQEIGLARADAALRRRDEARKAYATVLDFWKDAEPGLAPLAGAEGMRRAVVNARRSPVTLTPKGEGAGCRASNAT